MDDVQPGSVKRPAPPRLRHLSASRSKSRLTTVPLEPTSPSLRYSRLNHEADDLDALSLDPSRSSKGARYSNDSVGSDGRALPQVSWHDATDGDHRFIPPVPPIPAHLARANSSTSIGKNINLTPQAVLSRLEGLLQAKSQEIQLAGQLGNSLLEQQAELEARIAELEQAGGLTLTSGFKERRTRDATLNDEESTIRDESSEDELTEVSQETRFKVAELEKEMHRWQEENEDIWRRARGEASDAQNNVAHHPSTPPNASPFLASSGLSLFTPQVASFRPESPTPPIVGEGTNAQSTNRRARNAQHRSNDIEFATELGQGLLTEVRRLQALVVERDGQLREAKEEREGLWERNESLGEKAHALEDTIDQLKEENWNLEVASQDLSAKLTDAVAERSRIEQERARVAKQLMGMQQSADHLRSENDRATAALLDERVKFDTSMAQMRKNNAGLIRERSDLQGAVDGLKGELDGTKKQLGMKRAVSGVSTASSSRINGSTADSDDDADDADLLGSRGGRRRTGDALAPMSPSEFFSEGDVDSMNDSPARPRGFGSQLQDSVDADTLRKNLAHAQRTIATLRKSLQKEKEGALSLKSSLKDATNAAWEDENVSSPEPSPSKGQGIRGRRPVQRGGWANSHLSAPSKLSYELKSQSDESESDEEESQSSMIVSHAEAELDTSTVDHDMMDPAFVSNSNSPHHSGLTPGTLVSPNDLSATLLPHSRAKPTRLTSSMFSPSDNIIPDDLALEFGRQSVAEVATMTDPIADPEPVLIMKEIEVPVEIVVEQRIEVVVEVEKIVQVPVDRIVEKVVHVEKIVEKEVVVPHEVIKLVQVERLIEVPIEIIKIVEKVVNVDVERVVERIVNVPFETFVEKVIHVPAEVEEKPTLVVAHEDHSTQTEAAAPPVLRNDQSTDTSNLWLVTAAGVQTDTLEDSEFRNAPTLTKSNTQPKLAQLFTANVISSGGESVAETDVEDFEDARETVGTLTPSPTLRTLRRFNTELSPVISDSTHTVTPTNVKSSIDTREMGVQTFDEPIEILPDARKRISVGTFGALRRSSNATMSTTREADTESNADVTTRQQSTPRGARSVTPAESDRPHSITSSLYSILSDTTQGPSRVDTDKAKLSTLAPLEVQVAKNVLPGKLVNSKSASPVHSKPLRPVSPLPTDLMQRFSTPLKSQLSTYDKRDTGNSNMPPPSSTRIGPNLYTPTVNRHSSILTDPESEGVHHNDGQPYAETSKESLRRRANTILTSRSKKSAESLRSGRSRRQSFGSDRTSDAGDVPASSMQNGIGNGGLVPSTDPAIIHAITQTMIGEFLHKYTSKTLSKNFSEKRHRRFFWVHPYTKTLYWSSIDPGAHGATQSSAKSVFIEGVRQTEDLNSLPPGLSRLSIIIRTPKREVKLTAATKERHDLWFNALNYLLSRSEPSALALQAQPTLPPSRRHTVGRFQSDLSPSLTTPSPYRSTIYDAGGTSSVDRFTPKARSMILPPRSNKRADTAAAEFLRNASYFGSPQSSHHPLPAEGDMSLDFIERDEVNGNEDDKLDFEGIENVRACCDGKHDVGSLSRHHLQHHQHQTTPHGKATTRGPLATLSNDAAYNDASSLRAANIDSLRARFGTKNPTSSRIDKAPTFSPASPSLSIKSHNTAWYSDLGGYSGDLELLDPSKTQRRSDNEHMKI